MEEVDVSGSVRNKGSREDVKRNTNSDSIDKLTIRTKNGLVNGVSDDKGKSSKKHSKINTNTNAIKESKRNKKGHNKDADLSKKCRSGQTSNKVDSNSSDNCIFRNAESNCSIKGGLNTENSQTLISQREPSNKIESKSKNNKSEETIQKGEDNCSVPKFDINSIINSDNLFSKITETPSTSKLCTTNYPHLLEYQDDASEFEKNLIECIKNLKIHQDSAAPDKCDTNAAINEDIDEEQSMVTNTPPHLDEDLCNISYVQYESEMQMPMIMKIIQKDLSEPYSIYTYRYFIHNWPKLCFLSMCEEKCVGAIVCKLDFHRKSTKRGYIAMLAVDKDYRKRKIGSTLVRRAIAEMIEGGADEVVLETEVTNKPALRLYEQLGFVRDKRLFRYYLNGVDALRLKLWLR